MRGWIAASLALVGNVAMVLAQNPTPEATPPHEIKHPWMGHGPGESGPNGAAFENVRKALEALTPEQRKRFQENLIRWANLSPEEKKALRDREEMRKQMMEQETNAAIQESGLQLDAERREQFIKRYIEGRRQIEEQLHKDLNEKRKPLVRDLQTRLRSEFISEGTPVAPVAPVSPGTQQTTIQTVAPVTPVSPAAPNKP
jgi:hypothetical protein